MFEMSSRTIRGYKNFISDVKPEDLSFEEALEVLPWFDIYGAPSDKEERERDIKTAEAYLAQQAA